MDIEYRIVQGFPDYRVGNDGSVWSRRVHARNPKGEWIRLKPIFMGSNGYYKVQLYGNGRSRAVLIHHLVLETFAGCRPAGMMGLHWDDNRANNILQNLRWGTRKENGQDAKRNQRTALGENHGRVKYGDNIVLKVRKLCDEGVRQKAIADQFGMSQGQVSRINTRTNRFNLA